MSSPFPKPSATCGVSRAAAPDLSGLNAPQREAVLHGDGPMLVLAGAGSGKTRVMIARMARLLSQGTQPHAICGVTFTQRAARQLRERLTAMVGPIARKVTLGTFHRLGLTILQEDPLAANLRPGFGIYDTADQLSLVRDLMRQVQVADRRLDVYRVLQIILATKRAGRDEVQLDWGDDYELAAYDLYPRYLAQMRAFNAVDFDDLILRAHSALSRPEVAARWRERFAHVLVDEYQDTSPEQLALLRLLAGTRHNICAVGDDDQAIYAWRGAAADTIAHFLRAFPGAREVILDQNYRSTGHILAAAHSVIAENAARRDKRLWSAGGVGEPVEVVACADDEDEADFIATTLGHLAAEGVPYEQMAVLYRANAQGKALEPWLLAERVPFRVVGGQAFYDRKEVRDGLAFLALAHNVDDELALRRVVNVPPRGIGAASLERLEAFAAAASCSLWQALGRAAEVPQLPPAAVRGAAELTALLGEAAPRLRRAPAGSLAPAVADLFAALRLREAIHQSDDAAAVSGQRLGNLDALEKSVARVEARLPAGKSPLAAFMAATRRLGDDDEEDGATGQVTLMTLHGAKGLEFDHVLIAGVEEDLLPHRRSLEAGGELSEERRLCYVGMTRARRRLWLTWARTRRRHGKTVVRTRSRFLEALPAAPAVRAWERGGTFEAEPTSARAADLFARMRARLGSEESG